MGARLKANGVQGTSEKQNLGEGRHSVPRNLTTGFILALGLNAVEAEEGGSHSNFSVPLTGPPFSRTGVLGFTLGKATRTFFPGFLLSC